MLTKSGLKSKDKITCADGGIRYLMAESLTSQCETEFPSLYLGCVNEDLTHKHNNKAFDIVKVERPMYTEIFNKK